MGPKARHSLAYVAAFAAVLLAPALAYGAEIESVFDAVFEGPDVFLAYLLIAPLSSLITDVCAPLMEIMFDWGLHWEEIPFVNNIILWLQVLAIVAAVAVRIWIGLRDGVLQGGGDAEYTLGEYVFKSVGALIAVSVMPSVCRLVISFGESMYDWVLTETGGATDSLKWFDLSGLDGMALQEVGMLNTLWLLLCALLILILAIACGYQFVKRQIEMLTVCLVSPVVSVYAATEENSGQVTDLLKNLFGLVSMQWIQYVLVMVAIGFAQQFLAVSAAEAASAGEAYALFAESSGTSSVQMFMFAIASFGAGLTIPNLVDRYTFGAQGGRYGGIVVGAMIRGGLRAPGKIASAVLRKGA